MDRVVFRRIVCAIAHPDHARDVLRPALDLARLHSAELRVLHVTRQPHAPAGSVQRSMPAELRELREAVREDDPAPHVRWTIASGDPGPEIARYIATSGADLAVIGRGHHDGTTGRALISRLLRHAACPVLVVAPDADPAHAPFERMVCCVASGLSHATLRYALSLAQEYEGDLTVLNVHDDQDEPELSLRTDLDHLRAGFRDYADAWCRVHELAITGDPTRTLLEFSHAHEPQLIVLGIPITTSGDGTPGDMARAALGTGAHVLLVPPAGDLRAMVAARRPAAVSVVA